MDAFVIIVTIITCIIFFIVNIYITLIYKHREQSIFNVKNILCLILIMITLLQIQFQPLFMLVDVINSRTSSTDLTVFWTALYFSILVNLALIKPLITSIYESDEDDPMWKRILWITAEVFISAAAFGIFMGIGWLVFGYLDLDFTEIRVQQSAQNIDPNQAIPPDVFDSLQTVDKTIETRLVITSFLLGLLVLLGYPILICCGSCGLTALPLSLIMEFKNRPKFRRTSQARKIVDSLKQQTVALITMADQLKRAMTRIEFVDGWWSRRTKKTEIQQSLKQVQNRFQFHRDYYQLFRMQLKMQNVNPLVFIGKLILGIICIIAAIMLWVQILLAQLVVGTNGSVFLDSFFVFMEEENANFISIAFLMLICIFLVIATIKGTMFFSNNMPFITIHPMVEGKTWLNSFLFQLSLCVLSSASLVHLMIGSFPYYLRGGEIALLMGHIIDGMHFIQIFTRNKVFVYAYLIMCFIGGIFVLVKTIFFTQGKTQLLVAIQQKRKKLFGKQNKDKPLQMIQMTEMHLDQKNKKIEEVKSRKKKRQKQSKKKVKLMST